MDHSQERQTAIRSRACVPSPSPRLETGEAIDVFLRREDAWAALAEILEDEPDWAGSLFVVPIELDERDVSLN